MSSVGRISLDLNVNSKGFNKQVDGIKTKTTKAFGAMSVAVGNIMTSMLTQAVSSIGNFVKDSIDKGSELSELQNVVDSVFTTMSDKVENFSQNALKNYGLTEAKSKKMVGTYGAMAKSFGYTESQAYSMSTALTGLTADVASFYNLNHDEAYTKMKSVFTGETESLKELGVVMTQAALDQFALSNGFGKTTSSMSEQEKVALRLAFVQNKLQTASGDFLRTQDQWANQTRILTGQFESFKAALGQGFINILTPVIQMLNVLMAKLVQVANAFKSFTEMIMGKRAGGGAGESMKEVAQAANEAAGATGGIEDAAVGAAGAAKKAQKALMGFDEINRLQKKTDAGGAGGGGFDFGTLDFSTPVEEQENKVNSTLESIKLTIKELIATFKEGLKVGIGDDFADSLERIKEHSVGVKESIFNIFGSKEVIASSSKLAENMSFALGQVVGAIGSIGVTIGEFLVGGIDKALSQNSDFIKSRIVSIFEAASEYASLAGSVATDLASIFEVFRGDTAKKISADIFSIFYNGSLGVLDFFMQFSKDVFESVWSPIVENQDRLKEAIEKTLAPISKVLSTLNTGVKDTFESLFEVYESKIKPAFDMISSGLSSLVSTLLSLYNSHLAPVLDRLSEKFSEVWADSIQPAISKVLTVVGKVVELIGVLWKNWLEPFISWCYSTIVPVLGPIFEAVGNTILTSLGTIFNVIGAILDTLGGLIDFLVGIFTGDWDRAWEGVKAIFTGIWDRITSSFKGTWDLLKGIVTVALNIIKGVIEVVFNAIKGVIEFIWDGIKTTISNRIELIKNVVSIAFNFIKNTVSSVLNSVKETTTSIFTGIWNFIKGIINTILGGIETLVNGVISGLNMMIKALNQISFDVPDWVPAIGGGKFGFSIPNIPQVSLPRLAEGGYVRANQPQPVIVGDNRRHGEIISPEDKMLAITLQALEQFFSKLRDAGYSNSSDGDVGDIIIPIYLDGSMLDEVIVTAQQRRNLRSGGR